jgi:hypothetical protein
MKTEEKLYDLKWMVNGVVKETLEVRRPKWLIITQINKLQKTTHKMGKLIYTESK